MHSAIPYSFLHIKTFLAFLRMYCMYSAAIPPTLPSHGTREKNVPLFRQTEREGEQDRERGT